MQSESMQARILNAFQSLMTFKHKQCVTLEQGFISHFKVTEVLDYVPLKEATFLGCEIS